MEEWDQPAMRIYLIAVVVLLCYSRAQGASLDSPIFEARQGKFQCYSPNVTQKTCASIAAYQLDKSGEIENIAIVLISQTPVITMRTMSPVEIKANRVCGYIRPRDIEDATFTIGGQAAQSAQTTLLRQTLQTTYKDIFNQEVCTAYLLDGQSFLAKATLGGTPHPNWDQKVIWISPSDGYVVGP